jgi:hypothetical protein
MLLFCLLGPRRRICQYLQDLFAVVTAVIEQNMWHLLSFRAKSGKVQSEK